MKIRMHPHIRHKEAGDARRHFLIPWLACLGAGLASGLVQAADYSVNKSGTIIEVIDERVMYRVGGGTAVSMGSAGDMESIGVGAGWNSNLLCGAMSLTTTLENQLNGASNGFQTIMSTLIQNATAAVASLPALIIQRADPGLYNLLTNGILQARVDYDRSKLTCQTMAEKMVDIAGKQTGWSTLSKGQALQKAIQQTPDAVAAVAQAEADAGNSGVTWVGGQQAGGASQQPIRVVHDVAKAGYNLANGRSATATGSIDATTCNGGMLCTTWNSPDEVANFGMRVLGDVHHRTCETCTKTEATPGVGLAPIIQEEYEQKLQALQKLISGEKPLTTENLAEASSNAVPVSRQVIEGLREEREQNLLATRLASEVALSSTLEKALLLQRTLITGGKEPNIAANDLAQDTLDKETDVLQKHIDNLRTELEMRRALSSNAAGMIVERQSERREQSRGTFQDDPEQDRVQSIQQPAAGG